MNILYPGGLRSFWQDRNPLTQVISYTDYVTGDAGSTKATYTVPANRKGLVTGTFLQLVRETASGALAENFIAVIPNINTVDKAYAQAALFDNAIGAKVHVAFNAQLLLNAGDSIRIWTADANGTGIVLYGIFVTILEYDG